MNLPIEIVNKILIMRPVHPVAKLIFDFNEYLKIIRQELNGNHYTFSKCLDFYSRNYKSKMKFIDKRFREFDFCWRFFKFF
jgi:hypothetical protein